MANESFANTLLVEVGGNPLPAEVAALLTYAYVDNSRNLPDLFVLRFRDPQQLVLVRTGITIGTKVNLKTQTAEPSGPQPLLLAGEVTAVELELDGTGTVTEVRGLDAAHRLYRGRRVAAYPNMTVPDVVRRVAGRAHLEVGTIDPVPGVGGQPDRQFSQHNESDGEFLSRLADLVGAQLTVVDGALNFTLPAPPAGAPGTTAKATTDPLVLEAHRNLNTLRATVSAAEQVSTVEARGWDAQQKREVSATATARVAGAEVAGVDPVRLADTFASPPFLAADPCWQTAAEVRAAADGIAGQLGGACVELEGTAKGNPRLRAGTAVALTNVADPFVGRYTLTSTRHLFSEQAGYTTVFTVSGRQERSLYGLASRGAEASGSGGAAGAGTGLVPGIVSDVKDPLKQGRVRLAFPWLAKDFTSGWARTVQTGAGRGRGLLVLPEVGDEVLVGFDGGGLDAPYVLGGLYNGKDTSPALSTEVIDGASGEIAARGLVSRTGHRLELVENDGILLATGDGALSVRLDRRNRTVEIKAASGVTVDAGSGPLVLKSANGATVDAGTGALTLKGQQVSIQAQTEAELTANATVTVRGGLVKLN